MERAVGPNFKRDRRSLKRLEKTIKGYLAAVLKFLVKDL